MKTKTSKQSKKTVVQHLREVRDKINLDIQDMTIEQLRAYLKKQKTLHPRSYWQKAN